MSRSRTVTIVAAAGTAVLVGAGVAAYAILHTRGSPEEAASQFAAAWQRNDLGAMKAVTATPPAEFDKTYEQMRESLGIKSLRVTAGRPAENDEGATAPLNVSMTLKAGGTVSYQGRLALRVHQRYWRVAWTPAAVHPELTKDRRFELATDWPERAHIEDAGGSRMDTTSASGSVRMLAGLTTPATAEIAGKLGPAYQKGDAVGTSGLQKSMEQQLAGEPGTRVQIVGAGADVTLSKQDPKPGKTVQTTIDADVQRAAADAVRKVKKLTSLVAIKPSTGEILAVANNQGGAGGWNPALEGKWAPGSTFKTVTAVALLADGVSPGQKVECPKFSKVGGQRVRNSHHAAYGTLSFSAAFARSCNTTFAPLSIERLDPDDLVKTAESLGFNQPLDPGVPALKARFPKPQSDSEFGQATFGQARVTANPLTMAGVAAAIADGTWRPPTLIADRDQKATEMPLPDGVAAKLRPMMRAVVTEGTAEGAGLPDGTYGKTGSAEFGSGEKLKSHAWFHGFKGDLAFAVVVESGGGGGTVAAPVGARFLKGL